MEASLFRRRLGVRAAFHVLLRLEISHNLHAERYCMIDRASSKRLWGVPPFKPRKYNTFRLLLVKINKAFFFLVKFGFLVNHLLV